MSCIMTKPPLAQVTGADPGFLERGFIFLKFALLILSHFS